MEAARTDARAAKQTKEFVAAVSEEDDREHKAEHEQAESDHAPPLSLVIALLGVGPGHCDTSEDK